MRSIRLAPMTVESLVVCVALFIGCSFQSANNQESFSDVQRSWGAIRSLHQFEIHDGVRRVKEPELTGPFDAWDGEWWRVPVTAFHHADLLHLVLNMGAVWYLGRLLERRWGSFAMSLFLIPAVCLPIIVELCLGCAVVGFSGVICAMLGALTVLRKFDDRLAREFSAEAAEGGMAAIAVCWLLTLGGTYPFANAAHLTGVLYGALIAWITCGPLRQIVLLRISVVLMHVWLVPALFLAIHPYWIGRYHWYQAAAVRNPRWAEKSLERAVTLDPSLAGAWLRWSQLAEERQDVAEAWSRLVQGLAANPASAPLIDSTRRLWRHLDSYQREVAERILARDFGGRADAWLNQLRAGASSQGSDYNEYVSSVLIAIDLDDVALDQKIELPVLDFSAAGANRTAPVDPNDLNDAAEGRAL